MGCICDICGKILPSEKGMQIHRGRVHGEKSEKKSKKEKAPCIPAEESTPVIEEVAPIAPITMKAGDKVLLQGRVWRQDGNPPFEWHETEVKDILVQVLGLESNQEGTLFAYAKAAGSKSLWSWRVADFSCYTLILEGMDVPPEMSRNIDRADFIPSLVEYVSARDAKLAAEATLKKVAKDHKENVESYVFKYGEESEKGKQDFQVFENGFKVQMARVAGREVITYDDEARMRWIMEDFENRKYLLKTIIDGAAWSQAEEANAVPAEVLRGVKNISMTDDTFKLYIYEEKK